MNNKKMRNLMKTGCVLLLCAGLAFSLLGCQKTGDEVQSSDGQTGIKREAGEAIQSDGLTLLCSDDSVYANCGTEEGYYHIAEPDSEKEGGMEVALEDPHIMYVDYASKKEVYLCSNAGCGHDTDACTAVVSEDEFPLFSTKMFVWNGKLYLLSREADDEGSTGVDFMSGGDQAVMQVESKPAALYSMNLDGTDREKVYTFEDGLTLEGNIYGDANGIYVAVKKLTTTSRDGEAFTSASERKVLCVHPDKGSAETVCNLKQEEDMTWKTVGCAGNGFIFEGYAEDGSAIVYSYVEIGSDSGKELYRSDLNDGRRVTAVTSQNMLYLSSNLDEGIRAIDPVTGTMEELVHTDESYLQGVMGNYLLVTSWTEETLCFVDCESGEIHPCTMKTQMDIPVKLLAETDRLALIAYDYEMEDLGDGTYDITQTKLGLISKEDLVADNHNIEPITMLSSGR